MGVANWIAVAAVLAALLGSGITLYISRHRRPKIKSDIRVNGLGTDGYPRLDVQGIETPQGVLSQTAPTIDVRLVNSGTGTTLIVGCDIEVIWAHRFKHVRPPIAKHDRGGAALLPASAHYVALLPSPEEANGRSFTGRKAEPHPLEVALRGSDGLNLSHELKPGEADRFVVRVEVKPHGGGTLFDHAMPGDDRLAYQVRLSIRYVGGRRTQQLVTDKIGIVSPANELTFPETGQIREIVDRFRREVTEIENEINTGLRDAGRRPFNWAKLRSSSARDLEAFHDTIGRSRMLTPAFLSPDEAVRTFLDDLKQFCRSVLDEIPRESDLAQVFFPPARRTLVEIEKVRSEEFG
ncbi:hypothetical protein LDL08_22350 [Nonomuraea glycinis]|uniref:Uncharacterized protein n=1 Tax=Nonomuraea glycinis TaxID=2047744 RepID=A0A918A5F3_9ACTN|nr:hypothetical protein [Nonomuraea glycinis]MCA2178935.1 hypothetical protein [Nonomuraea glycinis]GGP08343.1 hypothetical protein GCM10012278_39680 [Nonomuraea glycinis]